MNGTLIKLDPVIEDAWNGDQFYIRAATGGGSNGKEVRYWQLRLNIEFVEDDIENLSRKPRDSTWRVTANTTSDFRQSRTHISDRIIATNENSINKDRTKYLGARPGGWLENLYKDQYPIVHEFGHSIGLLHPGDGKPGRIPFTTSKGNQFDTYTEDWDSLMGGGSEMRRSYFGDWLANLEATHADQGPFYIISSAELKEYMNPTPKPTPKPDSTKTRSPGYPG